MENSVLKLDLKGLKCPLPVLKTQKAMQTISPGDRIELETTDPLAVIDIPAFCNEKGHILVQTSEFETHHNFLLQKAVS